MGAIYRVRLEEANETSKFTAIRMDQSVIIKSRKNGMAIHGIHCSRPDFSRILFRCHLARLLVSTEVFMVLLFLSLLPSICSFVFVFIFMFDKLPFYDRNKIQ